MTTTYLRRRYIHRNANPVAQVCKIAKGKMEIDGLSQADAIKLLYKTVIPELRGEVLTGEDGAPLVPEQTHIDSLYSKMEQARRIAFCLAGGLDAKRELAELDAAEPEPEIAPDPTPEPEPEPEAPEPPTEPTEPTEPALPKHSYIFIEEGARDPSGIRRAGPHDRRS